MNTSFLNTVVENVCNQSISDQTFHVEYVTCYVTRTTNILLGL